MTRLKIGHVGLHVRNLEEEIKFLELLGAELTSIDRLGRGRVAFVSLDGVWLRIPLIVTGDSGGT